MTAPTAPFRFSLGPASVTLPHRTHYQGKVTVTNTGSQGIGIHMNAVSLGSSGKGCTSAHGAPAWLHLASQSFQLAPKAARTVSYTVSAPTGTTGSGAIVAAGAPLAKGHGNAQLSGAVGSRITLGSDHCSTIAAPVIHHGGGFPIGVVIVVALLALVVAALTITVRRVRRSA